MPTHTPSRRNSILIAAAIAVTLVVWIASGFGEDLPVAGEGGEPDDARMPVRFRISHARTVERAISVSAHTEPDRFVELKAETEGRVIGIGAERGAVVDEGQTLIELDMRDREARLAETEALIRQRTLEFEAAQRLHDQGFIPEAELAAAESLLVAARAARERIALDIERTGIRAPFDAAIQDRLVEIGDYVAIGDPVVQLVDADPLIVVGDINQREIGEIEAGSQGSARLRSQGEVKGTIRYIAPVANESTRSFRIELAVPNPEQSLRVGTSAELLLEGDEITAHTVSSGLLVLDAEGNLGVMTIGDDDRARFVAVELNGSSGDSVLVTGLPQTVRLITVGQGFVSDGQPVIGTDERAD